MGMEIVFDVNVANMELAKNQSFWDFKGEVDYVDEWFLMRTPVPLILITIGYLWFVLKFGPEYMKTKSAVNLQSILPLYNIIQVGFSCYLCYIGTSLLWPYGLIDSTCKVEPQEEVQYLITSAIYAYFFAKVTELLDTIFFVLKKNNHQVTFLHLYHHASMIWYTWTILKYEPSYSTVFFGTLNSCVHVIMYTYYCLSAVPGLNKYLWWKKYITKMQITQFLLFILYAAVNQCYSKCALSYGLLIIVLFNSSLFTALFIKFYITSYKKSKNMRLKE